MRATLSPAATLSLEHANTIVNGTLAEARRVELAPVAVLDAAGTTKALQAEDRVALMRPRIATVKAWGCLGLGFSTRTYTAMAERMTQLFDTFRGLADHKLVPSPGGLLISQEGVLIGAIGVSGDTGPNDELCAVAGVEAAGFIAQL